MARAFCIYVVRQIKPAPVLGDGVVGLFTVKHEMLTAVRREIASGTPLDAFQVVRYRDGAVRGVATWVNLMEELGDA